MSLLFVLVGAAVGAPMRYLTDRAVQARHDTVFPWGTLTVNVFGSLILGVITGGTTAGAVPQELRYLIGTGFCGALTTYSTFGFETVRLLEERKPQRTALGGERNPAGRKRPSCERGIEPRRGARDPQAPRLRGVSKLPLRKGGSKGSQ